VATKQIDTLHNIVTMLGKKLLGTTTKKILLYVQIIKGACCLTFQKKGGNGHHV
jgi:hypothetical protein